MQISYASFDARGKYQYTDLEKNSVSQNQILERKQNRVSER